MTWREFELRLDGLLKCDSRINRYLAPSKPDDDVSKEVDRYAG